MNYTKRRQIVAESVGDGVLVLFTNHEQKRSNDTHFRFRASSDFMYLSGFDEPESVLVIAPKHEHKFVLFVRPRNEEMEIWDGLRAGVAGAVAQFGADAAYSIDELATRLPEYLSGCSRLYYAVGENSAEDAVVFGALKKIRGARRKPDLSPRTIVDPRPLLHGMRRVKDADELHVLAMAGQISAEAHLEAMKATRPGMNEYEIDGKIEAFFRSRGAMAPSYTSIVAGGANACILHYNNNNKVLRDGDLLLVDAGCELDFYAGDVTRTWPVGRKFSGAQRELYELTLSVQLLAISLARVGNTNDGIQRQVVRKLTQGFLDLGLLNGDVDELIAAEKYKRFYMHGIGHYLEWTSMTLGNISMLRIPALPLSPAW